MGLGVLHPSGNPEDGAKINVDVVAIHGLQGHPAATWTDTKTKKFWLKDFLPTNLSSARIMTFGYNADAAFSSSTSDIDDHASNLLANVVDKREGDDEQKRPIVFVAHSLGGIIVKQALRQAKIEKRYMPVKDFTIGIIFLGTPHQGSDFADYSSVLSNAASVILHKTNPKATVDALKRNSDYLLGLTKDFRHQIGNYIIVSCYERRPIRFGMRLVSFSHARADAEEGDSDEYDIIKIVDKQSALLQVENEEQIPVEGDHQEMCKFASPTDETYEKLYKRMGRMVQDYAKRQLASQFNTQGGHNKYYGVPHHVSPDFMGREDVCKKFRETCLPDVPQHLQKTQKRFVLYGLGGSGKTQICLDFAKNHQESFWGIFYIDASTSANADRGFEEIADVCELHDYTPARTKRWLSNLKDPWLLILDNADDPGMDLGSHFPGGNKGTILITTRNPELSMLATVGSLEIGRLKLRDASKLLLKVSKHADPGNERSIGLANKTVETLGCLALAIVSAAALIRQNICSLEDYCAIFAQHRKRLLANESSRLPSNQANDVYTTWNISREAIESRRTDDAVIALELLNIFACLHFEGFTEQLFKSAWEFVGKYGESDRATQSAKYIIAALKDLHLFKGFGTQAWNPFPLREALNLIHSFSLISYDKDMSGKVTGFFLHPLVHSWGRDRMSRAEFDQWSTRSLALLGLFSKGSRIRSYKADRQVLAHISACSRQSGEFSTLGDADMKARMVADFLCSYKLQQYGRVEEACGLAERMMKLADARWAGNDYSSLYCLRFVGDQYLAMGECERAMGLYDTVLKFADEISPEERSSVLSRSELLSRYAQCLHGMGRFKDAVRIQKSVVTTLAQEENPQDLSIVNHMCSLIFLYHRASQYKEATELGDRVFSFLEQLLGTQNRMSLLTALLLAEGYRHLDQRSKSIEMYEWLAETYLSLTSPINPDYLGGMYYVTSRFFSLGLREKAKSLATSLVDMSQDSLGQEDPETQERVRWLHFLEIWREVSTVIEDPTRPITPALLDCFVATSPEFLCSNDLKITSTIEKDIAIIRQKLQTEVGCSHEVREEILKSLRDLEGSLVVARRALDDRRRDASSRDKRRANSHWLVPSDIKIAEWLRD